TSSELMRTTSSSSFPGGCAGALGCCALTGTSRQSAAKRAWARRGRQSLLEIMVENPCPKPPWGDGGRNITTRARARGGKTRVVRGKRWPRNFHSAKAYK